MKCLTKIHHRRLIYSFLFVVFSLFLSAVGSVSDSYATVNTCTFTVSSRSLTSGLNSGSLATLCGWSGQVYFKASDFNFSSSNISRLILGFSSIDPNGFYRYDFYLSSGSQNSIYSGSSDLIFTNYVNSNLLDFRVGVMSLSSSATSWTDSGSYITVTWSNDLSDFVVSSCPEPEEPEPCPPIPENPYDDKLDEIKTAIYCASAVMIMIYFFFIVYKIIVKDGGRR